MLPTVPPAGWADKAESVYSRVKAKMNGLKYALRQGVDPLKGKSLSRPACSKLEPPTEWQP